MGLARVYSNTNRRGNSVIKGLYELSSLENHTGVSDGTSTMCMCVHMCLCVLALVLVKPAKNIYVRISSFVSYLSYFLRQGLSLVLDIAILARLASQ